MTPLSRAGWSRIEITPPLGITLGGRGMVLSEATEAKAPLLGQVLILEDARGSRLLLVSLDLIGLSPAQAFTLRKQLASLAGCPPQAVILNCSHTHSGPFTHFEDFATHQARPANLIAYDRQLADALTVCTAEALERLAPATLHRHDGTTDIGINRRRRGPDGIVTAGPDPEGPYAPELLVLDIVQPGSGARCVAYSAACHPIIDCGWHRNLLSPDFPGATRDLLQTRLGGGAQVQFFQGACGNVRPRVLGDLATGRFRPCTEADVAAVATELAADVERTLCTPGHALELALAAEEAWVSLRLDESATPDFAALAQGTGAAAEAARYWLERPSPLWSRWKPWQIGLITLGPGCRIAWTSGEPLAEWQPLVREWLGDPTLTLWGYVGEGSGYLHADRHLPEGGYETGTVLYRLIGPWPLAPGIDTALEAGFRQLAKRRQAQQ